MSRVRTASSSTPLANTASANTTVGPFIPQLNRPIWLTLSGTWSGSFQLLRSIDAGVTKLPVTIGGSSNPFTYTANIQEQIIEETEYGASYYFLITIANGTVTYRVSQ